MRNTELALAFGLMTALGCQQSAKDTAPKKVAKAPQPVKAASAPAKPASAPATAGHGTTAEDREHKDPDGVVRRGSKLSEAAPMTVAQVLAKADSLTGKSIKVTGKVESVCMKKGCWMVLKEGEKQIRITSKGYKFFVPKGSPGQTAVIEGELAIKTLDVATAQHLEEERVMGKNEKPKKITEPQKEASIAAVGLEIRKG